ncbi:MAG: bifunctional hydroxymethylpyrimidine kinase/phosphomethylpyrimidine kinase [Candidatus Aureabacteria bacterium]|nr:bifunctional hydroxymethylpyrimidine kinase/phosphomethylpyrimidine kinase [Candidatus Auribacterota bacterium]
MRTVLTIAGSDSSCGAGIQADLKTFQRCGVYGVCAVTAVTAQDSARVTDVLPLSPRIVSEQINAVLGEMRVHAVKTGMLWSEGIIIAVWRSLLKYRIPHLVIDPVITSHGGSRLLSRRAEKALVRHLFPLADLVTPNLLEAEEVAGITIRGRGDILEAAKRLRAHGPRAVLIKGGHGGGGATDWYYDGTALSTLRAPRSARGKLHGSGCILSAAIAAGLAKGMPLGKAVRAGKAYVSREIGRAWQIGKGTALALHS